MRVEKAIELLSKLGPEMEIAIDWTTLPNVEAYLNKFFTDFEWETALQQWEFTSEDIITQVGDIIINQIAEREQESKEN
jgi:hypothetical protein